MSTDKRQLKKEIRAVCGSLAAGCIFASMAADAETSAAYDDIIREIARMQSTALRLTNVTFPRSESSYADKKAYRKERTAYFKQAFRALKGNFNVHVDEILKKMNALLPPEQKEANKEAAAK